MSKFCPFCGEKLLDEAKFCKNCGKDVSAYSAPGTGRNSDRVYSVPTVEKSHTLATVLGFVFAFLIPLIGIIFGIYLATRNDSPKAKRYGIIIIVIAIIVWVISSITSLFMY